MYEHSFPYDFELIVSVFICCCYFVLTSEIDLGSKKVCLNVLKEVLDILWTSSFTKLYFVNLDQYFSRAHFYGFTLSFLCKVCLKYDSKIIELSAKCTDENAKCIVKSAKVQSVHSPFSQITQIYYNDNDKYSIKNY